MGRKNMSVDLEIIRELVRTGEDDLAPNPDDWPDDWRYVYEERAAIMEFDGNLNRQDAEQWAETIVRAAYKLRHNAAK